MIFRVPIYVSADKAGTHTARPLFFDQPSRQDANLNRLISKLAREIVQEIDRLGKQSRQDECARFAFSPAVTQHRLTLKLELRRRTAKARLLFVAFRHLGKKLAFTPSVPNVWFEIERGQTIIDRATSVLTEHYRQLERDEGEVHPEQLSLQGKAWVQVLTLSVNPPTMVSREEKLKFLSLFSENTPDGFAELTRVGRCLDWLYPDELDRALHRDSEVNELLHLLSAADRRPVLLVGPRQVGKTTILHEVVHRRVAERRSPFVNKSSVWLISPQRLISGMSYVGQWENRLLAILKHAKKREHVLYFDDLVGLFLAGISASSTLNAAQVMKPYLERRDVRLLGEITPEALRVLQERDRSFADMFHVIPVRELSDGDCVRVLIGVQRRLEGKFRCGFDVDVLPAVIDLQRRYDRSTSFPGKAARMLARLAVKADAERPPVDAIPDPFAPTALVTRASTIAEFQAQSGLSVQFLDGRARLNRDEIVSALQAQVVGQGEAIDAAADVIGIAKARLNDPDRPLGAFLFLGPTGVGKTETAKAIARYLFGDADRLVRFDMNEFVNPGSATRLVGSFSQPEGLLTAAIRRRPFSVILLDEIEKADPEVFDLLLQVLGEGRLTDALGRTADFTSALIVLTSNLGVREAEASIGFREAGSGASEAYVRAAEKFFRPEFFNRLDRVIPFRRLTREHMRRIADRLVADVLNREGFRQRKCVLNVSPPALDRVIDAGYDPELGARAMKRAVERQLTQPAAARLAALPVERFTVVNVTAPADAQAALIVDVQGLQFAEPIVRPAVEQSTTITQLEAIDEELERVEAEIDRLRPRGAITRQVTTEQERYFVLKELATRIGEALDAMFASEEDSRLARLEARQPDSLGRRSRFGAVTVSQRMRGHSSPDRRTLASTQSFEESIRDLAASAVPVDEDPDMIDLEHQMRLLRLMATSPVDDRSTYLWLRGFPTGPECPSSANLAKLYQEGWGTELAVEVSVPVVESLSVSDRLLQVKGIHARRLAEKEAGTHLFVPQHGNVVPVRVQVLSSWPAPVEEAAGFGDIIRTYAEGDSVVDLRTGLVAPIAQAGKSFAAFVLAALD